VAPLGLSVRRKHGMLAACRGRGGRASRSAILENGEGDEHQDDRRSDVDERTLPASGNVGG
jgi:hypothetical protein